MKLLSLSIQPVIELLDPDIVASTISNKNDLLEVNDTVCVLYCDALSSRVRPRHQTFAIVVVLPFPPYGGNLVFYLIFVYAN